ncbi:MAG: hypothetical protein IPF52_16250 [Saprospiraceae bacterium]|nr:hypothetical protein [Saprospiraceae bacterium]
MDGPEMDGLTFGVRFGRDFNLSKRVALSADIGLNYGTADSVKIPLLVPEFVCSIEFNYQ